jgi:iron complex transport system substrate-binding protein
LTGRGNTANVEVVMRARPDVIIDVGSTSATYMSLAERVEQQTGVPYLLFDGTLAETPRVLREVSRAIGAAEMGDTLARDAETQLRDVAERLSGVTPDARPRVYFVRLLHPKLFPEPLGPRIVAFHRLYYHREPTETQVRALLETAGLSR